MTELIKQYEESIKQLEKRVEELGRELHHSVGGRHDELHVRIKFLNQEIDDMRDSINMMRQYKEDVKK